MNHKDIDINKHHIEIDTGVDREEKTALHFAVELGNAEIVKFLLEKSELDVNLYREHINVIDMFFKKKNIVKSKFVNAMDEIKNEKETDLYFAVEKGIINIVQILLTNENIDVNILCEKSNKKVVKVDDYDYESEELESMKDTALRLAVKKSNANVVKLLLTNPKNNINNLSEEIKSFKYSKVV